MTLIGLLVTLIIVGVVVYLINNLIPMDPRFKMVVNAVIGIVLLLWILEQFGFIASHPLMRLR